MKKVAPSPTIAGGHQTRQRGPRTRKLER